ncbi:hypothetical protein P3565_22795, partial [Vibrio parahaemolyticus]|nr:hypothetical protein [Vibrio parahaemolyticus]
YLCLSLHWGPARNQNLTELKLQAVLGGTSHSCQFRPPAYVVIVNYLEISNTLPQTSKNPYRAERFDV